MMPPAPGRGVSPTLPLSYLVTATAAFVVAALAVPWLAPELAGHYYQPRVLALTHTVTLGWITLTIMGASYQIVPIVLGRPIWSERLARWQLALTAGGIGGLVAHFYIGEWSGLLWAAGLVALGVGLHLVNAVLTVRGLTAWTFTARLVALAHVGLGLTALYGALLGVDKVVRFLPGSLFPNLHAHVHLALLGWVLPMVIGMAARVYPMFLLAREPVGWPGRVQLWGVGLGVPAVVLGILASGWLLTAGAFAVAAAVVAHVTWVYAMVRGRRRPVLDWGLRFVLTGALALVPATGLGLAQAVDVVAGPRVAMAYATLALGAWASLTIAGMMLKIVPFLVWYRVYGSRAGREAVPSLPDLGWPGGERLAWALLTGGFATLAGALALGEAMWIRAAGLLVAAGALAFAASLARVLQHLMPCARRAVGGGSDAAVSERAVMQALGTVLDPELGMSIVDLGLVYGVRIRDGAVGITMTLTAPGCPIHDVMPDWVRTAVMRVPGVEAVDVTLTFEPPWTPDRIKTPDYHDGEGRVGRRPRPRVDSEPRARESMAVPDPYRPVASSPDEREGTYGDVG